MAGHRTEFPEFGATMIVKPDGTVDYVRWEADEEDRADESDSQPDETG